jgi:hypothetical protein
MFRAGLRAGLRSMSEHNGEAGFLVCATETPGKIARMNPRPQIKAHDEDLLLRSWWRIQSPHAAASGARYVAENRTRKLRELYTGFATFPYLFV